MKLSALVAAMLLIVAGSFMGNALATGVTYQTLYAATANDVINDMLIAKNTRIPTKIRLAPGRYIFSRGFSSTYDANLLPMVSTTIQIIGQDPATTSFEPLQEVGLRFFTVLRTGNLSIANLTLKNGSEVCGLWDCSKFGGGVAYNAGGELDFHNCVLSGNHASAADGSQFGGGGAILNLEGHFLLDRTTVTDNTSVYTGAAISMLGGTGSIYNSTISGNTARPGSGKITVTLGGGIFVSGAANLYISGSTVSGNGLGVQVSYNSRAFGGGIYNTGTTTLVNSAVNENHLWPAWYPSGGIAPGAGGGIFNGGRMTIRDSTIGGNSVGTLGGGIYNKGTLQTQGVTITANSVLHENGDLMHNGYPDGCVFDARQFCVSGGDGIWNEPKANLTIMQTAVGGNATEDCNGTLISKSHNAIGTSLNCKLTASPWLGGRPTRDLVNLNLGLGELEDDGDAGNAHYPLLADSPLIDAGGNVGVFCSSSDQVGQRRVEGDADNDGAYICDIGAIEYQPHH
jgi:hypothetical protein